MSRNDIICPVSELLAVQLFLAVVAAVFYIEARLLLHAWLNRRKTPQPRFWTSLSEPSNERIGRMMHTAAALGTGCVLYGFLIEPSWIEVKTVRLSSSKIAPSSGTIRIAQISDFHSGEKPLNELRAAEIVNGLDPDIIAVAGDSSTPWRACPRPGGCSHLSDRATACSA